MHTLDTRSLVTHTAEAGAGFYALDNALQQGRPSSTLGRMLDFVASMVILWILWHFLVFPYLVITFVIFNIPTLVTAILVGAHMHTATGNMGPLVVPTLIAFIPCFLVWLRYPVYKWLFRKFIKPVDQVLSVKDAR